jgi:multidrug efflux pump
MIGFDTFIKRPVLTTVLSLLLMLFGIVAANLLSVRETPNIQAPIVTVTTTWFGADPGLMETDVTEILERQLNGIEGVRVISSTSQDQTSVITVEFELGRDLEEATNDVRSRVSRARKDLPDDVEEPIVEKSDADSQPVIFVRMDAPDKSLLELTDIADTLVRERLASISGVSNVTIFGEQRYAIRVELDPTALATRKLTVGDVEVALKANNVNAPAGRIEGEATELGVRLEADLRTVEQFEDLVVAETDGSVVRLGDIAHVRMGAENERQSARADGQPTVTVAVLPSAQANIIDISDDVYARLPKIIEDLPAGVAISVSYDRSRAVRSSIREVEETLILAFALVVLVIFAFLRDWRSTLVPALAIPVSLIGTFTFIWLAGFSINVFTLFGLVLAIGLVVDDAIVVVENVYHHIEAGKAPYQAAIDGTSEIAFAVLATTAVLIAVFVPVIFTGGTTGRLFTEFGATVAVSVAISAFVALTLTPMLSARLLRPTSERGAVYRATGKLLDGLNAAFAATLALGMRFPPLPLAAMALVLGLGGVAAYLVPREFFPIEDRNLVFISTLAPEGTSYDTMNARMAELEPELMAAIPERTTLLTRVGAGPGGTAGAGNTGMYVFPLVPREQRARSQQEIVASLREPLSQVTAFMTIPIQFPTVGRGFGSPLQFVVQSPDFEALAAELPKFTAAMRKLPGITAVNPNLKLNRPELLLRVDRDAATLAEVPIADIGRTLQVLSGGRELSQFKRGSRQYPVIVQLGKEDRRTPEDLGDLSVRNRRGDMVPLSDLLLPTEHTAAASRFHYDRSPSFTVSANLDGITLGEGIDRARAMAATQLPPRVPHPPSGEKTAIVASTANL